MIEDFFTSTVTVYRPVWQTDAQGNDYTAENQVDSFSGHLQQAQNPELVQDLGLSFSKAFTLWCPLTANVEDGDRLDVDGTSYTVRAKGELTVGSNKHLSLMLERH